ncbi:MAG: hypothetical protein AAB851_00725 [Patescibacteria group bacterium]
MSFLTNHKVLLVENKEDKKEAKRILDGLIQRITDRKYIDEPIRITGEEIELLEKICVIADKM